MTRFEDLFTRFPQFRCEDLSARMSDNPDLSNMPMTFSQFDFWIFFGLVYLGFTLLNKRVAARNLFLLAASLFFYLKTSGLFIVILVFSVIVNYYAGTVIQRSERKGIRKLWLVSILTLDLVVLGFFKYAYFFTDSLNKLFHTQYESFNYFAHWFNNLAGSDNFCVDKIILPIGISFFTFRTMSYVIDVFRREAEPVKNVLDFGFFVTFFPALIAGPILRSREFVPQMYREFKLSRYEFGQALFTILRGLVKKIVIADYIGVNFIDRILIDPTLYPGFISVLVMWAYSLQIYCDFSGYSDMAIGMSRLMGFRINDNFNSPYKARNVGEFWKRWHISLSSWLRDYLYIPLGGNRRSTVGSFICLLLIFVFVSLIFERYLNIPWYSILIYCVGISSILSITGWLFPQIGRFLTTDMNLMITMILGGIWHDNTLNFIVWGGLNGVGLVVYKYWKRISPYEKSSFFLVHFWKIFLTFNFITFTRIFFRLRQTEDAENLLSHLWYNFNFSWEMLEKVVITGYPAIFLAIATGFVIHWLPSRLKARVQDRFAGFPMAAQVLITAVLMVFIYQVMSDFQPFIYLNH